MAVHQVSGTVRAECCSETGYPVPLQYLLHVVMADGLDVPLTPHTVPLIIVTVLI